MIFFAIFAISPLRQQAQQDADSRVRDILLNFSVEGSEEVRPSLLRAMFSPTVGTMLSPLLMGCVYVLVKRDSP